MPRMRKAAAAAADAAAGQAASAPVAPPAATSEDDRNGMGVNPEEELEAHLEGKARTEAERTAGQRDGQDEAEAAANAEAKGDGSDGDDGDGDGDIDGVVQSMQGEQQDAGASTSKLSMADRMSKMKELRKKMNDSSQANRRAVAQEASRNKSSRSATSSSRKFLKAERILDERDQLSRGEDPTRARNWTYSIEDAERWNEKLQNKEVRRDKGDEDAQSSAERGYNRKIKDMKPDLNGYRKAKEADLGVGSAASSSSGALIRTSSGSSQMARRGDVQIPTLQSLSYGTHKPNEEALDKVISHMNVESTFKANRSRKRAEDPDAEVNYINNENKHFNNKIRRFYDESTRTIRENLERGTAL